MSDDDQPSEEPLTQDEERELERLLAHIQRYPLEIARDDWSRLQRLARDGQRRSQLDLLRRSVQPPAEGSQAPSGQANSAEAQARAEDAQVPPADQLPTSDEQTKLDRFELVATTLLALAAVLTAWAGFQASKWGGVQATSFSQAGAARTESVRLSTGAGQDAVVDVDTFLSWLSAVFDDIERGAIQAPETSSDYQPTPGTLSGFLYERLRGEFRPAVDAWLNTSPFENPDAPETPFDLPQYRLSLQEQAEDQLQIAQENAARASEANNNSDNYVTSTVLSATALFFAALSSRLRRWPFKVSALGLGIAIFIGTAIYVLTLPVYISG